VRPILAAVALLFGACTFPTVTYQDACEVPDPPCQIDKYSDDGVKARVERDTCIDECPGNPCKDACAATYDDTIGDLQRSCEVCSAENGCSEASAACSKWIGQ
jgi:hypothetical protein